MTALAGRIAARVSGKRIALIALAIGVGTVLAISLSRPAKSSARAVTALGAVELPMLDNEHATLSLPLHNGRPMVVNFFASWCEPCRRELPRLARAASAQTGAVDFVGIDHQDSRARAQEMLRQAGVGYPAGYDHAGVLARKLGAPGMPFTLFVDGRGRIVDKVIGELSQQDLDRGLLLLGSRK